MPATTAPSDRQRSYIADLLSNREVPQAVRDEFPLDSLTGGRGGSASELIGRLLSCPRVRVAAAPTAPAQPRQEVLAGTEATTIPFGTYTVVLSADDRDYVTMRVERGGTWCNGKTVIKFLSGHDLDAIVEAGDHTFSWKGFAFATEAGVQVWSRYRSDGRLAKAVQFLFSGGFDAAHSRFLDFAEAYALRSGRCLRCRAELTVPASIHRGLGPVCARVEGLL